MNNRDIERNEEIDFHEFFLAMRINIKFIVTSLILFFLSFFLFSLTIPNTYTAHSILSPTSTDSSSNLVNQYGNLAAIAGIDLSGDSGEVEIAIAFIKSKKLVSQLMLKKSFLPDLMAARSWSMKNNTVTYDSSKYDVTNDMWVRKVRSPLKETPSIHEAHKEFSKLVSVTQDKSNQFVKLSVEHISPAVAHQWALWIVKEANSMVANIRVKESQDSIDYLNNQIKLTPYAELKTMFYELIQQKTQSMMLAKVNSEYALTTIDPPLIPETKTNPNRFLISIMGLWLGLIFSTIVVLIRYYLLHIRSEINLPNWKNS